MAFRPPKTLLPSRRPPSLKRRLSALGTAITVSVIATIAVYSKKLAISLARRDATWLGYAAFGLRLGGGLVIVLMGGLLFWGSLNTINMSM